MGATQNEGVVASMAAPLAEGVGTFVASRHHQDLPWQEPEGGVNQRKEACSQAGGVGQATDTCLRESGREGQVDGREALCSG